MQHILNTTKPEEPIQIKLDKILFKQVEKEENVLFYEIAIHPKTTFPIAKTDEAHLVIAAKTFAVFSELCAQISLCPIFPEFLLKATTENASALLAPSQFFFDLVLRQTMNDEYIRQSFALRSLFCKASDIAYDEMHKAVLDLKKQAIVTYGKINVVESYEQSKKSLKNFGAWAKESIQKMVIKEDQQTEPQENKDDDSSKKMDSITNIAENKTEQQSTISKAEN